MRGASRIALAACACLGAAGFVLFCYFSLLHSAGSSDLSALKNIPRPLGFVIFDHSTYLAIARNAETGTSVFTEPFTGTGTSIYPPGYYWAIGQLARLPSIDIVAAWNLAGMATALALVGMCAGWARWLARGTRAWLLAPLPLLAGTLAWWVNGSWLGLFHQSSVVLWAPYAIIAMGTSEGFAMLVMGFCLLAVCGMLTSQGRRRLVLAAVAGGLLGLLFHVHAYVAIYTAAMVVAVLLADDHLRRMSARRLLVDASTLLALLAVLRLLSDHVSPTTKIALFVVGASALLVCRRNWVTRLGRPAVAIVLPAVAIAAPYLLRLAQEAGDKNSFFIQRQAQNDVRDLTLPVSSILWHELPILVLALATGIGLWRSRAENERAVPWLATLLAAAAVTPLLTFNHLWRVDQEPYRFLPYGMFLFAVLGFPWLWIALRRRARLSSSAPAAIACLLLLATVPTSVVYLRGVADAGTIPDDANVRFADERIARITGGELTLVDGCFNSELTRIHGGPHVVRYHLGVAFPADRHEVDVVLELKATAKLATPSQLRAAHIRWFATQTGCRGIPRAQIRGRLGTPFATFGMPSPELYGNPAGTRYEVYRVPAAE